MRTDRLTMRDREMVHHVGRTAMDDRLGVMKYEVGDMVWGKVKPYPWWPGQIFHEALASPIVSETKIEGHLLVAFFGDDTFGWLNPLELIPFDSNYMEKSKQTNARSFLDAVQDAEIETRKRAALGLSCCCRNPSNFEEGGVKGSFLVQVDGYGSAACYTGKQIQSARDGFRPAEMLCFLKWLALMPGCNSKKVEWIKKVAIVLAYRKAVFEEFDQTYVNAFGVGREGTDDSSRILAPQEKLPFRASLSCPLETSKASAGTKCFSRPTEAKRRKEFTAFDVSRVHPDQGQRRNFSSLPVYEKENTFAIGLQHSHKPHVSVKVKTSEGDVYGKSCETGLCCQDSILLEQHGRETGASYTKNNWSFIYQVPQLLDNLLSIALNPFRGVEVEHTALEVVLQFFQQVRSFMLVKNFVVSPSTEFELTENNHPESLAYIGARNSPIHVDAQETTYASKLPKKRLRLDDYEVSGKNDGNSCEKGGLPEKKRLKLSNHTTLSAKRVEKERALADPTRRGKTVIKNPKTSRKVADPTMLIMLFPLRAALPSVSELKARFARFGPFDSAPRLFFKSSTCRIFFKYKSDALAAYRYVVRNKFLFDNGRVDCYLQPLPASGVQPKSCLKKIQGDEFGRVALDTKRHVKFQLNGDQSSVENSEMNQPSGSSLSCSATAEIHGNWQAFIAQSPPAFHPLLNQITDAIRKNELDRLVAACNAEYEAEARKNCISSMSTPTTSNVDISNQMLNLMTRCNDVVSDLKSWCGYVPVHL